MKITAARARAGRTGTAAAAPAAAPDTHARASALPVKVSFLAPRTPEQLDIVEITGNMLFLDSI